MQKKLHKHFTVYDSGLVVQPTIPYLGATPDGKVFDPTCVSKFGLLEIKCPFPYKNITTEDACNQSSFPLSMVDGSPKLKKQHSVKAIMLKYKAKWHLVDLIGKTLLLCF